MAGLLGWIGVAAQVAALGCWIAGDETAAIYLGVQAVLAWIISGRAASRVW